MSDEWATVPAELRELSQWVVWKRVPKGGGKAKKVPIDARSGSAASPTSAETWCSFEEAVQGRLRFGVDGIGLVLTAADPYFVVDLDQCRDAGSGVLEPWAEALVQQLATYTEVSPSRTGLHLIGRGKLLPGRRRKGSIEMYDDNRYITVTGRVLDGAYRLVADRQVELEAVFLDHLARPNALKEAHREQATSLLDEEVIARARKAGNGALFQALWEGELGKEQSESEADARLAGILAFWCGPDPERVERLMSSSPRGSRHKWSTRAGYRRATIERAIAGNTAVYQAKRRTTDDVYWRTERLRLDALLHLLYEAGPSTLKQLGSLASATKGGRPYIVENRRSLERYMALATALGVVRVVGSQVTPGRHAKLYEATSKGLLAAGRNLPEAAPWYRFKDAYFAHPRRRPERDHT
jgi:primase-polymerase (primpol)-like protein